MKRDENGRYIIPQVALGTQTIVHDKQRNQMVMRLQGVVVPPVWATIELPDSPESAEVVRVRLLSPTENHPAHVCVDVKVPAEYCGESHNRVSGVGWRSTRSKHHGGHDALSPVRDNRGRLLYVGISLSALLRLRQPRQKGWWPETTRCTLEHFPSRKLAAAAELRAIRDEKPRFNIQGRSQKEGIQLVDEEAALGALFGFPDDHERECYFDARGLSSSIGWNRNRLQGALARLLAKRRIALWYSADGHGHALLLEPAT